MKLVTISRMFNSISVGWQAVGVTLAIAGVTIAATKGLTSLLKAPQQLAAHDSTMRAESDTQAQIARESLKQLRLTNCILLGIESKLACSLHASH